MLFAIATVPFGVASPADTRATSFEPVQENAQNPPNGPVKPLRTVGSPQNWVALTDYPSEALEQRAFGRVHFRLDVDINGRAVACHVLNTSGFWLLDNKTCTIMLRQARFKPAEDGSGKPIPARFTSSFFWAHGDADLQDWKILTKEVTAPIMVSISVNRLPTDYTAPALVRARFGEDGKVAECRVELTSGNAKIDAIACRQVEIEAVRPQMAARYMRKPDTRTYFVMFGERPAK